MKETLTLKFRHKASFTVTRRKLSLDIFHRFCFVLFFTFYHHKASISVTVYQPLMIPGKIEWFLINENDARWRWMMSYDGERCLMIINDILWTWVTPLTGLTMSCEGGWQHKTNDVQWRKMIYYEGKGNIWLWCLLKLMSCWCCLLCPMTRNYACGLVPINRARITEI